MSSNVTPAWTLILVPPKLTASTKRVGVKMRTIRMLCMLLVGIASASWMYLDEQSTTAALMADRIVEQERAFVALHDTVESLRSVSLAERARRSPPPDMIMPVVGQVTSRFSRARFHPILQIFRAHRGVDLSAPSGTRIVAPAAGTVTSVGRHFGFGLMIEVMHSGGVVTRYVHCRSILAKRGDLVAPGQVIATVGSSGLATAPHLHFEVLVKGTQVDPIKFIASTRTPTPTSAITPNATAPGGHE